MSNLDELVEHAVDQLNTSVAILELVGKAKDAPATHLTDAAADARVRLDKALERWGKGSAQVQ